MIYIGDNNNKARKVVAPVIGVKGVTRRVLKGYIGVADKAQLFYDYLDDIDYVEVKWTSCGVWTARSSDGGTKLGATKALLLQNGSFSCAGDTTYLGCNRKVLYIYPKLYAVLKGGYELPLNYPFTNDGKSIVITVKGTGSSGASSTCPFVCMFTGSYGGTNPYLNGTQSSTYTMDSNTAKNSGQISDDGTHRNGYKFSASIGGVTYPVICVDALT